MRINECVPHIVNGATIIIVEFYNKIKCFVVFIYISNFSPAKAASTKSQNTPGVIP